MMKRFPIKNIFQKCSVDMTVQVFEQDVLILTPKDVFMESPTELTRYTIVHWSLEYRNKSKQRI